MDTHRERFGLPNPLDRRQQALIAVGVLIVLATAGISPAPAQAPGAEEPVDIEQRQRERDEEQSQVEKEEVATNPAPRSAHIARPGAPREPLPNFFEPIVLQYQEPSAAELRAFDDMARGRGFSEKIIDLVAKHHVYRLTRAQRNDDLPNLWDESRNVVADGYRANNTRFISAYKAAVVKYSRDLLKNSVLVRVNVMALLQSLYDNISDPKATPVFLEALQDATQPDAVYFMAMRGLDKAKSLGQIAVRDERAAAAAILQIVERGDVQPILLEKIVATLGELQRPYAGVNVAAAEVATLLANVALDPKQPSRTHVAAAIGLARLNVDDIRSWRFDLQSRIVVSVLVEMLSEFESIGDPPDDWSRFRALRMWQGLREEAFEYVSNETQRQQLEELLKSVETVVQQVLQRQIPDLGALRRWLEDNPMPSDARLAPEAPPLGEIRVAESD